jgi:serine protease
MPRIARLTFALGCACCAALMAASSPAAVPEYNPIHRIPVAIGPETNRLIVGFRATPANAASRLVSIQRRQRSYTITQAQTTSADVKALALRAGLDLALSRQITPSMHVLFLPKKLYGAHVAAALAKLRADPAVQFAAADQRRYALGSVMPNDPLFVATVGVQSGQWYLDAPNPSVTVEGVETMDLAATDAVDAWGITTGSPGIVIADVDTGVLFGHPDLLRAGPASLGAGFGGRLLPGYDFVGQDYNPNSPYNGLGTYLIANDGDGWDPDPSDPGDWISTADAQNALFSSDPVENSSWHGTRVVGIFGALTNNNVGVAGMTWGSWILPVRALGKGGGYDSDIIAGVQWAAGLTVTNPDGSPVPDDPYPADIINLSIGGGTDACSSSDGMPYETALTQVTEMGVLIVIAAGNANGNVELPANCAGTVPGVMAVAGLRNVGTKVGYSSFGSEVSVSAPAGNCINATVGSNCLRSIDTTTDLGLTVPGAYNYTNEQNPNLGTSFATPIVSGIAALMRSVNGNLTPVQLAARMEMNATPFPANTGNIPICPNTDPTTQECSCPASGQCGVGMVNAYQAVQAAQAPIAAVAIPATISSGSNAVFDGSGSAASCGRTLGSTSYAWTASGGVTIVSGANASKVTILPGSGTLTLTVTDNIGGTYGTDTATITVSSDSATTTAPATAGNAACPAALDPSPQPPTITQGFSPASVAPAVASTLTLTLNNANGFALTQSHFSDTLPAGVKIAGSPAPTTTCMGANGSLTTSGSAVTLSDANVPANGSCSVTLSVSSSTEGTYTNALAANALMTAPAGGSAATSATLTVAAPAASGGGGGVVDWLDVMFVTGVLLAGRRHVGRRHRGRDALSGRAKRTRL